MGSVFGKIRFIEPQGVNGHKGPVPGASSGGTPRESQAQFRGGTVWGLYNGLVGIGPTGSVFRENSFYPQGWGTRLVTIGET